MSAPSVAGRERRRHWSLRPLRAALDVAGDVDSAGRWVALVAAAGTLLAVAFLWSRITTPFDGTRLEPGEPTWRSEGVVVTPIGEHSGKLNRGDLVIAVNGRSLEKWAETLFQLTAPALPLTFDQIPTYTVVRDGERLDVPVSLGPYPLAAIVAHHWGVILYLLILQVGGLALMRARPRDRAARLLFLIGWCGGAGGAAWWLGLQVTDLVSGVGFWHRAALRGIYMLAWIAVAHFAPIFPRPHPFVGGRKWVGGGLYGCHLRCTAGT